MQCVPFEQTAIDAYPSRDAWDATAAELVGTMLERWHLEAVDAFVGGAAGSVLTVRQTDGIPAVLKVGYPHWEGAWEAVGLELLGADAPAVLRQDPWTWSLLLEKVEPGDQLVNAPLPAAEALAIGGELLARIAAISAPRELPTLADAMASYLAQARDRLPGQHSRLAALGVLDLVTTALDTGEALANSAPADGLVHGDFNPGNILRSADGWKVIDPKPMRGEAAFDLWPLVSQVGHPWRAPKPHAVIAEHLAIAAAAAECDPMRAARWALARSGINVTWYLADDEPDLSAAAARELRTWAAVA